MPGWQKLQLSALRGWKKWIMWVLNKRLLVPLFFHLRRAGLLAVRRATSQCGTRGFVDSDHYDLKQGLLELLKAVGIDEVKRIKADLR